MKWENGEFATLDSYSWRANIVAYSYNFVVVVAEHKAHSSMAQN